MKTHKLCTLLLMVLLTSVCTSVQAQMTDQVLLTDYQIDPEKKGDLSVELDNVLFFKNNEFDGDFLKGYSLPGLWIQPKLVYNPLSYMKLEVGAHALIYRGAYKYPNYGYNDIPLWKGNQYQKGARILPFVRAQATLGKFNLVLGNIYGGANHALIEPLYNPELNLTADPEAGVQLLYDAKRFHLDLWVNWESFIFKKDNHQEAFTMGLSTKTLLNDPAAKWHLYMPLQVVGQHRGGEDLVDNNRPVSTFINGAIGLGATRNYNMKWFKALHFEADVLGYYQQSGNLWPLSKGIAGYARTTVELREDFLINAGYFMGHNFISLFGSPYFGSISMTNDNLTFDKPQTVSLTAEYYRIFAKHYGLGAKVEVYQTFSGDYKYSNGLVEKGRSSTNFTIGVYLRVNPSFLIKKF